MKNIHGTHAALVAIGLAFGGAGLCPAASDVAESARPRTWWHWFGDTITTNGITHDLEAMKEMGLGGASIYASHWTGLPPGPVKCLSDAWYDHVVWAGKEADRLGLELGFHNCPGWCNTGGPWVRPEYAQKHLVWTETRLDGGKQVDLVLPKAKAPFGIYRPVAVLAIPDREDEVSFAGPLGDFVFDAPRTVSSVVITLPPPGFGPFNHLFLPKPNYVVSVSDDGKTFREHFRTSETCAEAEHTLTFPAVRAKAVRIAVAKGTAPKAVRVAFRSRPLIPHARRKSYGNFIWVYPLVPQETFACPDAEAIPLEQVIDLTDRVDAAGRLVWTAPAGKWIVLNFAATVMDKAVNHISTPSGTGLECDKLSREGVEEGARGPVSRIPELARQHGIRAFRTVHIDSSESPAQNWTDRMPEEFRQLRGYDLRKYLPTFTGRYVGSASVSERFLRDFRFTVNDLMIRHWGRQYAETMHKNGLSFEMQAYNWPFNQLEMAQCVDIPMGEFWIHTGFGSNDATKLAAMQGDLYGKRIVSCEAFTDACPKVMTDDNEDIAELRREGDRRFANGITRFVFQAYTHQPSDDPAARTNYWRFGIRIDRHHPKFAQFKPWIAYLTETQAKLQQGRGVADAVVLMREDVTLDRSDWDLKDPPGYRSNAIERKLFLSFLSFRDGRLRLPSGMEYRLLVLPDVAEMTPAVLEKTLALVEAGAEVLLRRRPVASPSLTDFPSCDASVERLAKKLWDVCPANGSARIGKGRVWRGVDVSAVYAAIGLKPDLVLFENGRPTDPNVVVYTHRVTAHGDLYFVANVTDRPRRLKLIFRSGATREISLNGSSSTFVEFPAASDEYDNVIHPGPADGSCIWNRKSQWFMYAPVFAFKTVNGAVKYRFTVLDDMQTKLTFEADRPTAPLTPVWSKIPTGFVTVTCEGADASGCIVGKAGERKFWKAAGFREGTYQKAAKSYRETALGVYRYIFNMKETQYLLKNGKLDASYELNTYASKMCSALIRAMISYGELDSEKKATALAVARAAADHLIRKSEPAGAPLAFFPPTYDGRGEKDNGYIAEKFKGQIMLVYPAYVAMTFLDLAKATGEARYREAAERIAGTYLKLQGEDGTWFLKMWAKDGKPVCPNRLVPIDNATPMFERLFAETGKTEYRAAADRSFASLEGRLADWNWEGQFEDVVPTARYEDLTKHGACSTAIYLSKRFPNDPTRRAQVRELLRFAEDQFVCWEPPYKGKPAAEVRKSWADPYEAWATPCALEQYDCYVPIDASAAKLIRTYLAAYRLEGRHEDLAKARALGDTATRMQCPNGRIPTWWWPARAKLVYADWINCMIGTAEALLELDATK